MIVPTASVFRCCEWCKSAEDTSLETSICPGCGKPYGTKPIKQRAVVELALEVSEDELSNVLNYIEEMHYAFYIEPPYDPPIGTLEELEAQREGKK